MNERTEELAKQASEYAIEFATQDQELYIPKLMEKFAELILTEVIGTIYRSDISDKKQERLVQELAHKFGFLGD